MGGRPFFVRSAMCPNGLCAGIGTGPGMSLGDLEADCQFYRYLGSWGNMGECSELLGNDMIPRGFAGFVSTEGREALDWKFSTRIPDRLFNYNG
jgi:hypothetical protein